MRAARPCGRAGPSLGGPPNWACVDTEGCTLTRWLREPIWLDHQVPGWRYQWNRHKVIEEQVNWLRSRAWSWYHPETYGLYQHEVSPAEFAALSMVRDMVEEKAVPLAAEFRELKELALSASWPAAYDQPAEPVQFARLCRDSACDHITMRCPDNRTHTLGHFRQQRHVIDAAGALAHRKARQSPRESADTTD